MGQTLDNGIYLPSEGERNCYDGLAANWRALDAHLGNTDIHVTYADKQAWNEHVADTVKHVTASDKQTWNGKQDALSQTQLDAVNSGIDSSKVQQIATNTSDISSLQSGKANDSDVVHKSGNETISGTKTFLDVPIPLKSSTAELGVTGGNTKVIFTDKNLLNLAGITFGNYGSSKLSYCRFHIYDKDSNNQEIENFIEFSYVANNQLAYFRPNQSNFVTLGTVNNRWSKVYADEYYYGSNNVEFSRKFVTTDTNQTVSGNKTFSSINGVEPSSLSLPSGNANDVIDISSYITALDGTSNSYTVPANGWISIAVVGTAIAIVSSSWSDSRLRASSGNVRMLYPVLKNETLGISVTGTTLSYARFIPCQGNV